MGIDIGGFIECHPWVSWPDDPRDIPWEAVVPLDCLYINRDYDAFGCLFGVMNFAGFRPVAADRGLPDDVSDTVRREHDETDWKPRFTTWIGWDEIQAIDWDEPAEHADVRLHEYHRTDDGQWPYHSKCTHSRESFEARGLPVPPLGAPLVVPEAGGVWTLGDVQYRAERLVRRDAVPAESLWRHLWKVMAVFGELHGPARCRLVVWFEN